MAVRTGDRVRLRPHNGGDILDIALRGQIATIEGIEEDYEGKRHVCVVLDEDPGRDLGMMRQPGHRFFFDPTEIEPLPAGLGQEQTHRTKARVLIAGIGNIFLGDDAFGVEVARRLADCELPDEVRVVDFGIRGLDLVYALQDGYDTTILIDAFPHGKAARHSFHRRALLERSRRGLRAERMCRAPRNASDECAAHGKGYAGASRTHPAHWLRAGLPGR